MKSYTIKQSSNYSQFINNDEQREHKEKHIQELKESMSIWGFVPSQPVATSTLGAKFLIIDGHSRFDAARQLKIPIYFILLEQKFAEAVAILNIQKAWGISDHARRYAVRGNPDYVQLMKYTMLGIPLQTAASMLYGQSAGSGNAGQKIKHGEFKVRDTEQIGLVREIIEELGELCPVVKTRHFIEAFSMCYFVPEFDVSRFKTKLANFSHNFTKTVTRAEMLNQIDELYNYKASIKIPLAFKAVEVAKQRNAAYKNITAK